MRAHRVLLLSAIVVALSVIQLPASAAESFTAVLLQPETGTAVVSQPTFWFTFDDLGAAQIQLGTVSTNIPAYASMLYPVYDEQTGTWSCTPSGPLADGTHTLYISALNSNNESGGGEFSILIDTSSPSIALGMPTAVVGPDVHVTGTFYGMKNSQIGSISIRAGDIGAPQYPADIVWDGGGSSGTFSAWVPLSAGWKWVDAILVAPSGLQTQSGMSVHVYEPPPVTFNTANGWLGSNISGTFDGAGYLWVSTIKLTTPNYVPGFIFVDDHYEKAVSVTESDGQSFTAYANVPAGQYEIHITFVNSDSVSVTSIQQVNVDAMPPVITPANLTSQTVGGIQYSFVPQDTALFNCADTGSGIQAVYAYLGGTNCPISCSYLNGVVSVPSLPIGTNWVLVYAVDIAGNWGICEVPVTVDVKPTFTSFSPGHNSALPINSNHLQAWFTSAGIFPIAPGSIDYEVTDANDQLYDIGNPSVGGGDANFFINGTPPVEGNLKLRLRIANTRGLYSEWVDWTVKIDRTDPVLTPAGPTSPVNGWRSPTVKLAITEASSWTVNSVVETATQSPMGYTVTATGIELHNMENGQHSYTVTATDQAGNSHTFTWEFFIERFIPVIAYTSPQNYSILSNESRQISAVVYMQDVEVALDWNTLSATLVDSHMVSHAAASTFDAENRTFVLTVGALASDDYVVHAQIADEFGNMSLEELWHITVSAPPPTFSNLDPGGNEYLLIPSPVICGNYSTILPWDIDKDTFVFTITDAQNNTVLPVFVDNDDTGFVIYLDPDNLPPEGELTVTVAIADTLGTTSIPITWNIKVDKTPPTMISHFPNMNSQPTGPTASILAEFSDNMSGVNPSSFVVRLDGQIVQSSVTESGEGVGTALLNLFASPATTHTVRIEYTDFAGNFGVDEWEFEIPGGGVDPGEFVEPPAPPPHKGQDQDPSAPRSDMLITTEMNGADWNYGIEGIYFKNSLRILDNLGNEYTQPQFKPITVNNLLGDEDDAEAYEHWDYPLAFPAEQSRRISVKVVFSPIQARDYDPMLPVYVRGHSISINVNNDKIVFPETLCSTTTIKGHTCYVYEAVSTTSFDANTVNFFKDFDITWEVADDINDIGTYKVLGKPTRHTVYVVRSAPVAQPYLSQSVYYFACKGVEGQTQRAEIIERVFDKFMAAAGAGIPNKLRIVDYEGEEITTVDPLTYYGPFSAQPPPAPTNPAWFNVAGLLKNRDGRCEAFAALLRDCYNVHGIEASARTAHGKAVRKKIHHAGPPARLEERQFRSRAIIMHARSGQNNATPPTTYKDHVIVYADVDGATNKFFDPSYGRKFTSFDNWQVNAVNRIRWVITGYSDTVWQFSTGETPPYVEYPLKHRPAPDPDVLLECSDNNDEQVINVNAP